MRRGRGGIYIPQFKLFLPHESLPFFLLMSDLTYFLPDSFPQILLQVVISVKK